MFNASCFKYFAHQFTINSLIRTIFLLKKKMCLGIPAHSGPNKCNLQVKIWGFSPVPSAQKKLFADNHCFIKTKTM